PTCSTASCSAACSWPCSCSACRNEAVHPKNGIAFALVSPFRWPIAQLKGAPMGILAWIVLGLIAGVIAKLLMPGEDPGGFFITILIGIAGALVGGAIAAALGWGGVDGINLGSVVV